MPLNIKPSSGSGSITLQATTGTTTNDTLTLPAATGTVALTASPTFTGTTTTGAQSVGGNITFSAADAGIIFNKTGALTNTKLNDYETGTWTPTNNGSGPTITNNFASYVKIGKIVTIVAWVNIPTNSTATALAIGGLPFAVENYSGGAIGYNTSANVDRSALGEAGGTYFSIRDPNSARTWANYSNSAFIVTMTYTTGA